LPRVTSTGGIPSKEGPCVAICRASLAGSAPCDRTPGGRNSSAGSIQMNSRMPAAPVPTTFYHSMGPGTDPSTLNTSTVTSPAAVRGGRWYGTGIG